ncbi:MAG: hypothetical protein EOO78_29650 [Oxalobacteraceae bacterium]|nr:MAG: hypothetical protein EOO78_29650 [Oxalobacteraceae bacterium]
MPLGSGVTCVFADGHVVSLIGPTRSAREQDMLVSHELLHPILNTLFDHERGLRRALFESQCVFDQVVAANPHSVLTRFVYNSWESYWSEAVVRAISHRLSGVPQAASAALFVGPYLDGALREFEQQPGSFAEANVHAMQGLRRQLCGRPPRLAQAAVLAAQPVQLARH